MTFAARPDESAIRALATDAPTVGASTVRAPATDAPIIDAFATGASAIEASAADACTAAATSWADQVVHVVLSGGAGTRLWPVSRESEPKQTSAGFGADTLLQQTVARLRLASPGFDTGRMLVVCGMEHRFLVSAQLQAIGVQDACAILEPCRRGTAPALTLAALASERMAEDAILVVTPTDHAVADAAAFGASLGQACRLAAQGHLVALGVAPDSPQTGYGYIALGRRLDGGAYEMRSFEEKPDAATAADYLASGCYWWNCGVFVVRASVWLALARRYERDMAQACHAAYAAARSLGASLALDAAAFAACPSISIDHAVMERVARHYPGMAAAVPLASAWSDLGSWDAMWRHAAKDAGGNATQGRVVLRGVSGSIVHAQGRLVACLGVKDVVVIETADAILVADRHQSQQLGTLVKQLSEDACTEAAAPRRTQRPWGNYDVVDSGEGFRVKRLTVAVGGCLSLQRHAHRAEHWLVVRGRAQVSCEGREFILERNQSFDIPAGAAHRLANAGEHILEVIEIQTGSYFGEDDNERLADRYGRAGVQAA